MIRLRGHLICLTDQERAGVLAALPAHIAASRAEPGCLSFDVSETDDPLVFEVMEAFRTRADFDAHQACTRDSAWFAATRGILRDYRVEEIGD